MNYYTFRMILITIVIIGAINWGFTAMNFNLVEKLSIWLNQLFNSNISFDKIIYILVALSAIWIATKRSTWLPFLGKAAIPTSLLPLKENKLEGKEIIIDIKTIPNKKIAYWAAIDKGPESPVKEAYDELQNSGVVMSDDKGNAKLRIIEGNSYIVPSGRKIPKHVHYRVLDLEYGLASRVETVYY